MNLTIRAREAARWLVDIAAGEPVNDDYVRRLLTDADLLYATIANAVLITGPDDPKQLAGIARAARDLDDAR